MATLTRAAPSEQERKSHEMGMHTEQLAGRTQQVFEGTSCRSSNVISR